MLPKKTDHSQNQLDRQMPQLIAKNKAEHDKRKSKYSLTCFPYVLTVHITPSYCKVYSRSTTYKYCHNKPDSNPQDSVSPSIPAHPPISCSSVPGLTSTCYTHDTIDTPAQRSDAARLTEMEFSRAGRQAGRRIDGRGASGIFFHLSEHGTLGLPVTCTHTRIVDHL